MLNKNLKTDSRVRFQNRGFKTQLQRARTYKRTGRPQQDSSSTLKRLSGKIAIILLAVILAGAYFLYAPNIFSIKKVTITGLNPEQTDEVKTLLAQYFAQRGKISENNILALSAPKLTQFLLTEDPNLLQITQISKHLFGTLTINAVARENKYLLSAPEGNFIVSSDGLLNPTDIATTATSSLIRLSIIDSGIISAGAHFGNATQLAAIELLQQKLADSDLGVLPDHYEIQNYNESDITVYMANGSKYFFDYKNDILDSLNKLHLLLTSIAPGDAKRLAYVDMRIKNRGYVCLNGTPCAALQAVVLGTSTPDSNLSSTSTVTSTLNNLP